MPRWIAVVRLATPALQMAGRWQAAGLLDPGEAEALALATQEEATWFLTDDAAARWIAENLGQEAHGSLGLVLWSAANGRLSFREAEEALERLAGTSLWVSARVLREARAALRQIFA